MILSSYVNTFGQAMLKRYGRRVHKLALNAGLTCPNRDGSKGRGGCTFCNNTSFTPGPRLAASIPEQIEAGRRVISRRTGATCYIAYFQAYTNTYADVETLARLYDQALAEPDVIGLSVGTRPDCLPDPVFALLADYQARGYEVWLELGLQSASNETLQRINRGHGFEEYLDAVRKAHAWNLQVCTHLIVGLPGEDRERCRTTLRRVLEQDVEGLKLHPLHVVKGTLLANQWRRGEYAPLSMEEYVSIASDLIALTPPRVVYHRVTGTASETMLLAPGWCAWKWRVINGITRELRRRMLRQGQWATAADYTKVMDI